LEDFLDTTIKLVAAPKEEAQEGGACFDWTFTKTRGNPVKPDRLRLTLMRGDDGTLSWKFGEAPQRKPQHETLRIIFFGPDRDRSSLFAKHLHLAEFTRLRKGTISKHIKALRSEGLATISSEGIAVTDAGIERLERFFPDDDFES
jgi:hypothetical protein